MAPVRQNPEAERIGGDQHVLGRRADGNELFDLGHFRIRLHGRRGDDDERRAQRLFAFGLELAGRRRRFASRQRFRQHDAEFFPRRAFNQNETPRAHATVIGRGDRRLEDLLQGVARWAGCIERRRRNAGRQRGESVHGGPLYEIRARKTRKLDVFRRRWASVGRMVSSCRDADASGVGGSRRPNLYYRQQVRAPARARRRRGGST